LLAHTALTFYINDEASVTDPVYKFELNSPDDFSSVENFIDIDFTTKDSLSLKFYAIQLFQKLIAFHLNDDEKDALVDVDLARLNFVRRNSVHTEKDSLYILAIVKMEDQYSDVPYSSLISFNKAKYFYDENIILLYPVHTNGRLKKLLKFAALLSKNIPINLVHRSADGCRMRYYARI